MPNHRSPSPVPEETLAPPAVWRAGAIHSAYVRIAFALVQELGLRADVQAPTQTRLLPLLDILPLLDTLDAKRSPQLGAVLGDSVPAAAHGALGYAAVSSTTIGKAMATVARLAVMRNRLFSYHCTVKDNETILSIKPQFDLQEYRPFLEIATSVSVFKMIRSLAGAEAAAKMKFDAQWSERLAIPGTVVARHSCAVTALRVPSDVAQLATLTADAKLYAMACQSCEEELEILDGSIAARLRAIMPDENNSWPTLLDVADRFAMSPRTLIRRLRAEGLTYQALLDEAKSEMACWYLRSTRLSLSQIADQLGFLDNSNFSRSFRRWRDMAPLSYRKSRKIEA